MSTYRSWLSAAAFIVASAALVVPGRAETITGAMAKAYQFNSALNSARAGVRIRDEDVPIAKSGYRPTIIGTVGAQASRNSASGGRVSAATIGIQINQRIFDGFQTLNNVRAAEARVRAQRESLRNTEQNTLADTVQAYMDVIAFRYIAVLGERNLEFLVEQVRAARSRFEVGEGTRTDVAQAEASRSEAVAGLATARAQASTAEARYRELVGEDPGALKRPSPIQKPLPPSLDHAFAIGAEEHPVIHANEQLVDAAAFTVKQAEGALLPELSATAEVSRNFSDTAGGPLLAARSSEGSSTSSSIGATLTIPLYQGGLASAQVRQAKETLGQARIDVDVARDQVRSAIAAAWTQFEAARESVTATGELVAAAQLALNGVIEERNVGQRTTLDVLNAQADVINAQIRQVQAVRDSVVFSYQILQAIGRLSVQRLGLQVAAYKPKEHYEAVKDKWYGLRTPDAR